MSSTIRLNGEKRSVDAATIAALIEELRLPGALRGIAVAINGAVVPRTQWVAREVISGDEIEIVRATQGG